MVAIEIDGKKLEIESGCTLLQAARRNNIYIPTLCYDERLTPTGACRLCIVKIVGQDGFFASCTTEATNGMKIKIFDKDLDKARSYILSCLLSECNISNDLGYDNELLELIERCNLDVKNLRNNVFKLHPIWKNLNAISDVSSPVLTYEFSKCVKCFKCIKACSEIQGKNVLSFADRGINKYIVAGFGNWSKSECDGCGECIQICPTGAIIEKLNRGILKKSGFDSSVQSTCSYCGVGCRIIIKSKDNLILRIDGMDGVKPNNGRLCVKGRFGYEFVNSNKRLTKPLIKNANGNFEEVSWDKAIGFVANKFNDIKKNFGNDSLAGYSSAKCTNEDNYIFQKFVRIVFGTNNLDYCTRLCHASTITAMLEAIGSGAASNSINDYETADCIMIIGNNMVETHPVTATFVKHAVSSNNARLIIIDPKWTPLAKFADIWLRPKLGTDIALINGIVRAVICKKFFDEKFIINRIRGGLKAFYELKKTVDKYTPEKVKEITDVEPAMLLEVADIYGKSKKAMVASGMGISQQLNGTDTVFSLLNLCLITGKIGQQGSGLNPPRGQNNVQGASDVGCLPMSYPGYIPVTDISNRKKIAKLWKVPHHQLPDKNGLTTVEIIKAAYNNEIKGMYIMGENPMLSDPNLNHTRKALKNLDFLLVQDIFLTETTKYADVIFPGVSFAEKNGTFVSSDRRISRVRKAIKPPGKAKQDWRILSNLAKKMGYSLGNYTNESDIFNEIVSAAPIFSGISYDKIEIEGIQWPYSSKNSFESGTLFVDKFNTSDGLASLNPVEYKSDGINKDKKYPFLLNSGRVLYQYHTGTMSRKSTVLTKYTNSPYLLMNDYDAANLNLISGQMVKIISKNGEIQTVLKTSTEVRIGELFMPFHYHESQINKLTSDTLDPYSKIPAFKRTACRVEKMLE